MKCPVCKETVDSYEICENCNYQNSGPKEKLFGPLGPNKMSLWQARRAYKKGKPIE